MGDEAVYEDDIEITLAEGLVGDVDFAVSCVPRLGRRGRLRLLVADRLDHQRAVAVPLIRAERVADFERRRPHELAHAALRAALGSRDAGRTRR